MKAWQAMACTGLTLALSGCGFHPLYGSVGKDQISNAKELQQVRIDTIADRVGQELRNELIDRMQADGVPPPPVYELIITYSELQQDLGINNNAVTTRGQLTFSASYKLVDIGTGKAETSGVSQHIDGYNIQYSEFGTIVSRDDAEVRAVQYIADNITSRLAFYFENKREHPDRAKAEQDRATQQNKAIGTTGTLTPVAPSFQPLTNTDPFGNQSPINQAP